VTTSSDEIGNTVGFATQSGYPGGSQIRPDRMVEGDGQIAMAMMRDESTSRGDAACS